MTAKSLSSGSIMSMPNQIARRTAMRTRCNRETSRGDQRLRGARRKGGAHFSFDVYQLLCRTRFQDFFLEGCIERGVHIAILRKSHTTYGCGAAPCDMESNPLIFLKSTFKWNCASRKSLMMSPVTSFNFFLMSWLQFSTRFQIPPEKYVWPIGWAR